MAEIKLQGWAKPSPTARSFHYFQEGNARSLCRRWLFFGNDPRVYEDTMHDHPDNCKVCKERYAALPYEEPAK